MKKFLIAAIALLVFATTINAQKKKGFAWNKKVMTEIGLSADQQVKVEGIKESSNKEMDVVKADGAMAEDAKKTKLHELQKKRASAIDSVLTVDQKKKADEMKAKIKAENEGGQ
jgi:hypothetical protein